MDTPPPPLDIEAILEVLDRHGVDYIIIGGFAVAAHGYPRATKDVDFTAAQSRDNLEKLAAALTELQVTLRGIGDIPHDLDPRNVDDLALGGNWTLTSTSGWLDYIPAALGASEYHELKQRAIVATVGDRDVLIVGLDDLVAMKRASGRARDRQDLAALAERHPHLRQAPDLDPPVTTPNDPPEQKRRWGFGRRR